MRKVVRAFALLGSVALICLIIWLSRCYWRGLTSSVVVDLLSLETEVHKVEGEIEFIVKLTNKTCRELQITASGAEFDGFFIFQSDDGATVLAMDENFYPRFLNGASAPKDGIIAAGECIRWSLRLSQLQFHQGNKNIKYKAYSVTMPKLMIIPRLGAPLNEQQEIRSEVEILPSEVSPRTDQAKTEHRKLSDMAGPASPVQAGECTKADASPVR